VIFSELDHKSANSMIARPETDALADSRESQGGIDKSGKPTADLQLAAQP